MRQNTFTQPFRRFREKKLSFIDRESPDSLSKSYYVVEIDGSARYNPGPAGVGIRILKPDKKVYKEISRFIGVKTNNQAEYEALLIALKEIQAIDTKQPVLIKTDSELLYRQLTGQYRIKDKELKLLYDKIRIYLDSMPNIHIIQVPREENKFTDKLAKAASKIRPPIRKDEKEKK